ncbi:MAG: tripartite tricarboxylate transporter substrate binding protein [Betaproteobacteria bacterium]|nr:tripartite tricarboxylate transporter substrate binding protein [Betaproteobacteria bacterium]
MNRTLRIIAGLALAAVAVSAAAQTYPQKPIRLIIPFPPGGPRDVQARLIGPKLTEAWGQPVVVDNRAGANGIIGIGLGAKAEPDGYTLVMISAGFAAASSLYAKLPYDSVRDFAPVAPLTSGPGIVVVNPSLPVRSIRELVAHARSRPGQLFFGSAGNGAPSHLAVELFKTMAGIDLVHVPYKGMAPAITDLIAGRLQLSIPTIPGGLPHAKSGKVRALAVTGAQRSAAAPELPTVTEAGLPGYLATNWYGLVAPARTPRPVVGKLNQEIGRILAMPEVRERLTNIGMEPESNTPEQFAEFIKSEIVKWAKVVKAAGVRLE